MLKQIKTEPFYFGTQSTKLFGVYHPSQSSNRKYIGVVPCYPIGQEYLRSHRTFLHLANRLSSEGLDVLRFDYSGCGDSYGNGEDFSLADWRDDVCTAVNELQEGSDIKKICLVGLRLGANIALEAANILRNIDYLVLLNPVINGLAHICELRKMHSDWMQGSFVKVIRSEKNKAEEILGFELPDNFIADLQKLNALNINQKPAGKICILESTHISLCKLLQNSLINTGAVVDLIHIPAPEVWIKQESENKGLVPINLINTIVTWIS